MSPLSTLLESIRNKFDPLNGPPKVGDREGLVLYSENYNFDYFLEAMHDNREVAITYIFGVSQEAVRDRDLEWHEGTFIEDENGLRTEIVIRRETTLTVKGEIIGLHKLPALIPRTSKRYLADDRAPIQRFQVDIEDIQYVGSDCRTPAISNRRVHSFETIDEYSPQLRHITREN